MKAKRTIRDIANELQLSITTVSLVLNGKARQNRISQEVIDRVLKFVKEVDYRPNHFARSLRNGKSKIIAFMAEDISNPFFSSVARLIEDSANNSGYKIVYCSTENNTEKTRELIRTFKDRRVDAYIITPTEGIEKDIETLVTNRIPLMLFDRYFTDLSTGYVVIDNEQSTCTAIQHFIEQGYRQIGFVTLDSDQTQMSGRYKGYIRALEASGLPRFVLRIPYGSTETSIIDAIINFLAENREIDSLFFSSNYLGISGLKALKKKNLSIPDDIGVIAFDDSEVFRMHTPTITTVTQPVEEISHKLVESVLNQLRHEESSDDIRKDKIKLPAKLVVRESTARKK
ncbi:LacI family DNA-binding transcriptional regulator [Sinomicrobium weinanense]|uniref:LacI family DNA-binding transcriptional regulator n=1 Tax=Sinomicrobium weinanense TaxID=2842200 RepID=A0A926JQ77_9FLAO|nr:LacI family DNA-binding transcriptional regulator [Sinomicrobium weinanense]MBC9795450.1 LacI family DNA-binding transcriptional regulator [Sinomicrobium weinanense]MBU3123975.1 LacI family transcriptional regulator [Sinomicrobium weinanense]